MNEYKSSSNSKIYLINECCENHSRKYTHNILKGTASWEKNDHKHCLLIICSLISHIEPAQPGPLPILLLLHSKHGGLISMQRPCSATGLHLQRYQGRSFLTNHLQPWKLQSHSQTDLLFQDKTGNLRILLQALCPHATTHSTSFFTVCLCFACYFHQYGARLTMQAQCQLPLLPDGLMGFGYMHMLR